jgi:hypothetical protein
VSGLSDQRGLANGPWLVPLPGVRLADFCNRGHGLSGYEKTIAGLVQGYVVRNESETRGQRPGASEGVGVGKLSNCLVVVA